MYRIFALNNVNIGIWNSNLNFIGDLDMFIDGSIQSFVFEVNSCICNRHFQNPTTLVTHLPYPFYHVYSLLSVPYPRSVSHTSYTTFYLTIPLSASKYFIYFHFAPSSQLNLSLVLGLKRNSFVERRKGASWWREGGEFMDIIVLQPRFFVVSTCRKGGQHKR